MATLSLKRTVEPACEPVALDEFKLWAKITTTSDDAVCRMMISAARESAEAYLRRALITQTWQLNMDLVGDGLDQILGDGVHELPITELYGGLPKVVNLPRAPIQSITSVTTYDLDNNSSVFPAANYRLDAEGARFLVNFGYTWPSNLRARDALQIIYVAGYGTTKDIPRSIRAGIMMHAQRMYDERIVCELPDNCARLYRQYRINDGLFANG